MKRIIRRSGLIALLAVICSFTGVKESRNTPVCYVSKLTRPMKIDADWNKPQWKKAKPVVIQNYMGDIPAFKPEAKAKIMYDDENIYVIFQVKDRFVRCLTDRINGPVYKDGAVEFFFAPDQAQPLLYFNLETNCGGTPLMHFNLVPRKESKRLTEDDIKKVEIAASLPRIIDPELKEPVTWTLEYKIPLELLEKYASVTRPAKGVEWRANFYKIAENSSNPHYITWALVENEKPDFHKPQFFGKLIFR